MRTTTTGLVIGACAAMAACKQQQPAQPQPQPVAVTEAPPQEPPPDLGRGAIATAYRACWARFNERAWDQFEHCYADDVVSSQAGLPQPIRGRDELMQRSVLPVTEAFPDGTGEVVLSLVYADNVASIIRFAGTQSAPWPTERGAIPATNRPAAVLMLHQAKLLDQQIIAETWVRPMGTLLGQIGAIPQAASAVVTPAELNGSTVMARLDEREAGQIEAHRRMHKLLSARDRDLFGMYDDQVVSYWPGGTAGRKTRAEMADHTRAFWDAFDDVMIDDEQMWAAGNYTVSIGRLRGTVKGSADRIDQMFGEIIRWDDRRQPRVVESYLFYDDMPVMTPVGEPPPAPPPVTVEPAPAQPPVTMD
ncbi:MAG TPA: nuclear transport factor 2 family protein [Kofleriaceae bacterium]|nr:nuclear transport factor 2 family protein [Kofleriaceae bacterium]